MLAAGMLGAATVVARDELSDASRPMQRERWAGVIDTVGGPMLAAALAATKYDGAVTCCGLVASPTLETTVFPFILRGVNLLGNLEGPVAYRARDRSLEGGRLDRKSVV